MDRKNNSLFDADAGTSRDPDKVPERRVCKRVTNTQNEQENLSCKLFTSLTQTDMMVNELPKQDHICPVRYRPNDPGESTSHEHKRVQHLSSKQTEMLNELTHHEHCSPLINLPTDQEKDICCKRVLMLSSMKREPTADLLHRKDCYYVKDISGKQEKIISCECEPMVKLSSRRTETFEAASHTIQLSPTPSEKALLVKVICDPDVRYRYLIRRVFLLVFCYHIIVAAVTSVCYNLYRDELTFWHRWIGWFLFYITLIWFITGACIGLGCLKYFDQFVKLRYICLILMLILRTVVVASLTFYAARLFLLIEWILGVSCLTIFLYTFQYKYDLMHNFLRVSCIMVSTLIWAITMALSWDYWEEHQKWWHLLLYVIPAIALMSYVESIHFIIEHHGDLCIPSDYYVYCTVVVLTYCLYKIMCLLLFPYNYVTRKLNDEMSKDKETTVIAVGDCRILSDFLDTKSTRSWWIIPKFINAFLRCFSQVFLCDSPITGFLIYFSLLVVQPLVAVTASIAAIIAIGLSVTIRQPCWAVSSGLTGFNAVLVGAVTTVFIADMFTKPTYRTWPFLIFAIVLCVYVSVSLNTLMARLSLPALSIPFNVVQYLLLMSLWYSQGHQLRETSRAFQRSTTADNLHWEQVLLGVVCSAGQVLAVKNTIFSSIIYVAILLCSPITAAFSILGALVGTLCGLGFGADFTAVYEGIWGYNPLLCGAAIGGLYYILNVHTAVACLLCMILASVLQLMLLPAFPSYLTVQTLPFCISALMFLCLSSYSQKTFPKPGMLSFPERHRYEFMKMQKIARQQSQSRIEISQESDISQSDNISLSKNVIDIA